MFWTFSNPPIFCHLFMFGVAGAAAYPSMHWAHGRDQHNSKESVIVYVQVCKEHSQRTVLNIFSKCVNGCCKHF